ncbi:MAG: hypothetical protein KIT19_07975 [Phycisphaeraceae bacterium]|nr:hypothetical protein [Phycisphaeraceae bacterium]
MNRTNRNTHPATQSPQRDANGKVGGAGTHVPAPESEDHIARAMRVLMDLEWPGPNPSDRNHRIEEAIMAGSTVRGLSKRHIWAGGILLLLAGSAIGAVATNIITQRFTGYVELEDGSRVPVQGEMMIETDGDRKQVTINAENLPAGAAITGGEWHTQDGRVIRVQPVDGGAEATFVMPAGATEKAAGGN